MAWDDNGTYDTTKEQLIRVHNRGFSVHYTNTTARHKTEVDMSTADKAKHETIRKLRPFRSYGHIQSESKHYETQQA